MPHCIEACCAEALRAEHFERLLELKKRDEHAFMLQTSEGERTALFYYLRARDAQKRDEQTA